MFVKLKNSILFIFIIIGIALSGENNSQLILKINGRNHVIPFDFLKEINKMYIEQRDSVAQAQIGTKIKGAEVVNFYLNDKIGHVYFTKKDDNEVEIKLNIDDNTANLKKKVIHFNANLGITRWKPTVIYRFGIKFTLQFLLDVKLHYENQKLWTEVISASVTAKHIHAYKKHKDIISVIENFDNEVALHLNSGFKPISSTKSFNEYQGRCDTLMNLSKFEGNTVQGVNSADEFNAVLNSVPIHAEFGDMNNSSDLIIDVDFLNGYYTSDGTFYHYYDDYTPDVKTNNLKYAGFGYLHWGKYDYIDPDNPNLSRLDRFNMIVDRMDNLGLNQLRIEAQWNELVPEIDSVDPDLDPSTITENDVINYMNSANMHWDDLDAMVNKIVQSGIEKPVLVVGCGHSNRPPKYRDPADNTLKTIAPGTEVRGENADQYYPVPENVYLYWLKLYTRAVVHKYINRIAVYQAENELDAARFTESYDWWRKGNAWHDDSDGGFQDQVAQTLYNAIKDEAQAMGYSRDDVKVVQAFHLFGAAKRIKDWHDYYDILGLNIYPNQLIAYPNLAFMTGEFVWAARRILKSMGDDTTPVWITETGYPAKTADPAPASLDSTVLFFNEQRQSDYLKEAMHSCNQNGAQAFIWYLMGTPEQATSGQELEQNNNWLGLYHRDNSEKQALDTYDQTFQLMNQRDSVLLANKYNDENLDSTTLDITGIMNGVPSGTYVKLNNNQIYEVRTSKQDVWYDTGNKFVRHNHWNDNYNNFKLENTTTISPNTKVLARFDDTYPVNFAIDLNGYTDTTLSKQLEIRDPWFVDAEGGQANVFHNLASAGNSTNYKVFKNQQISNGVYYSVKAPYIVYRGDSVNIFKGWQVSGATLQDDPDAPNEPAQKVAVFTSDNSQVTAEYWTNLDLEIGEINYYGNGVLKVKAPKYVSDKEAIYRFKNWTTNTPNAVSFGSPNDLLSTVTISGHNAQISAEYENCFLAGENIDLDGDLAIPPGARYEIPPNTSITVNYGSHLYIEGTDDNPIVLDKGNPIAKVSSMNDYKWSGINITGGKLTLKNALIKNADIGVKVDWQYNENGPIAGPVEIYNCTFVNNNKGIEYHDYPSWVGQESAYLDARNNIFYNNTYGVHFIHDDRSTTPYSKINYNDFYQNTYDIFETWDGSSTIEKYDNIYVNPSFVDETDNNYHLNWGSPCINAGDPDYPKNVDSTRIDIGAYYYPQLSDTLKSDLTLSQECRITDDLVISEGTTLRIEPNTVLKIEKAARIDVYGTLIADGTSDSIITFTSIYNNPSTSNYWDRIYFRDTAVDTSVINYCKLEYSDYGVYIYKNNIDITNSEIGPCNSHGIYLYKGTSNILNNDIHNCNFPIYLSYCNDYSTSMIKNNHLYNSVRGIFLYKSSPNIIHNEINDNVDGIYCSTYSSPSLGYYDQYGQNYIHDNDYGIWVYHSSPFLGREMCTVNGGENSFERNTSRQIYAYSYSTVTAQKNWWGTYPPSSSLFYHDGSSSIDYSSALHSKPLYKLSSLAKTSGEESMFDLAFTNTDSSLTIDQVMQSYDSTWVIMKKLLFSRNLIRLGFPEKATEICYDIIKSYPDSSESYFALDLLWQAGRGNTPEFKNYKAHLDSISKLQNDDEIPEEAEFLLDDYESDSTLAKRFESYKRFKNPKIAAQVILRNITEYLANDDYTDAVNSFSIMKDKFPDAPATNEAKMLMNALFAKSNVANEIPDNFVLLPNYPNPFNPETNFHFGLPDVSSVEITIYNVLGQRIFKIRRNLLQPGFHIIKWNARNKVGHQLASGLYVYHFKAIDPKTGRVKFVKSGKLLFLK